MNYGYEGELLLPMSFTAPADARPGQELRLRAKANWLVCHDVCIPESATLELRLPVVAADATPGATAWTALFERAASVARARRCRAGRPTLQHSGRELLLDAALRQVRVALPARRCRRWQVFPFAEQLIEPAVHELYRHAATATPLKLRLLDDATAPTGCKGVAVAQAATGARLGRAPARWSEFNAPLREVAAHRAARRRAPRSMRRAGWPPPAAPPSAGLGLAPCGWRCCWPLSAAWC